MALNFLCIKPQSISGCLYHCSGLRYPSYHKMDDPLRILKQALLQRTHKYVPSLRSSAKNCNMTMTHSRVTFLHQLLALRSPYAYPMLHNYYTDLKNVLGNIILSL